MSTPPNSWTEAGAIAHANLIDDWIAIEPDGTVVVKSGKVELGTGTRTALAQIAAEELDIPLDRIRMIMGDTELTPDEGYTAGSKTINFGGIAIRLASAAAHQALLELASDQLDAAVDELTVHDGVIAVAHHPIRTITYAELMGGKRFNREITGDAPVKRPEQYHIVGTPAPRKELPDKFTGLPSFVQDLRLNGMLHARVVRPAARGCKVISYDESSLKDLASKIQIVHIGDFLAVVAEREEHAVRAMKELAVKWGDPAPVPSMDELYTYLRSQPTSDEADVEQGDVAAALASAATRLHATYYQPFHAHASIGPSCAVADFRGDSVTIWSSTQGVYPLRGAIADLLKMPERRVHLIHMEGAGGYGQNGSDDAAADAAVISRAVQRPIRLQWSRENEFAWEPYAPAMIVEVSGGLDNEGHVIAWDYGVWTPTHANRPRRGIQTIAGQLMSGQPEPPNPFHLGGDRNAPTNYSFQNHRVVAHWLGRSPLRASSFRSLGATANTFANESFMDELAYAAHADPVEFRIRHLKDARAHAVIRAAAERSAWGTPLEPNQGRGLAYAQYENEEAYLAAVATVRVDATSGAIKVERVVIAHDCGLIINPDGLRNQIEGNVIQSMSRAMKEQVTWEDGRITSVDWDTYPILKFSEVPDVDVILINHPEERPVGAGEPSSITTAPAIANAVFNATGARLRQVPFTPKRVREALKDKKSLDPERGIG